MNAAETERLLRAASAIDNRKVTSTAVEVWQATLADIPYDEAATALIAHRRSRPGVWFEPGHIIEQRKLRIARERELNGPHPAPPAGKRWAVDAIENDPQYALPGGVTEVPLEPQD